MHIAGQSTSVTERMSTPKRLPAYWFESRRRYYSVTFGTSHAIAIDIVALVAHSVGMMKRVVLGRRHTGVPHFIRDVIHHSPIWPRNRYVAAIRCKLITGA
jgi:N-acetylglucosaminyl-diphospho-decaprenol L-rhamnosyltransferase